MKTSNIAFLSPVDGLPTNIPYIIYLYDLDVGFIYIPALYDEALKDHLMGLIQYIYVMCNVTALAKCI